MAILRPSVICSRVTDITPELLKEMNIKALLLDAFIGKGLGGADTA